MAAVIPEEYVFRYNHRHEPRSMFERPLLRDAQN
jgi:hypothetical protein